MNNAKKFLNALTQGQSYRNILYLFLSFPLGVTYFVFLVTGLSLGVSLLILWVGIPLLLATLILSEKLLKFERYLAHNLLDIDLQPVQWADHSGLSMFGQLKQRVQDPMLWKGITYLFVKFPLGVLAFVVCTVLITLSLSLITAPLTYHFTVINVGFYHVDTPNEAFLTSIIGLGVAMLSMRWMNSLALWMGRYAVAAFNPPEQDKTSSRPL